MKRHGYDSKHGMSSGFWLRRGFICFPFLLFLLLAFDGTILAGEEFSPLSEEYSAAADTTGIQPPDTVRLAREENFRAIAREQTALQDAQVQLQKFMDGLNAWRETLVGTMQLHTIAIEALRKQSMASISGSSEADALYDRLVDELQKARIEVATGLKAFQTRPSVPRYQGEQTTIIPLDDAQRAALKANAEQIGALKRKADSAAKAAEDLTWYRLNGTMHWADRLNNLRLAQLKKVSPAKHDEILGWGRSGMAQLRREWNHLNLLLKWLVAGRKRIIADWMNALKDPYKAGTLATQLILCAGLILLYTYARRKGRGLLDKVQGAITEYTHSPILARRAKPVFSALDAMWDEICLLIVVLIAPNLIGFSVQQKLVYAGYSIVLWYAVYRLVTRGVYRLLAWKISTAQQHMPPESAHKMLRSVLWVGRYVLAVTVILICSSAILGQGYLYHVVTRLAWIGAIPICTILMRWWRADIADTYLRLKPDGNLANAVRATRMHWYGFFVTVAAFGVLLADAMTGIMRRFIFGFEQTQRMLAYLFRKKLERVSQAESQSESPRAGLPLEIRAYFDESPSDAENLLIDYFPEMSRLEEDLSRWHDGGRIGAVALIGEDGFGKTTWLMQACKRFGLPSHRYIRIDHRVSTSSDMLSLLAKVSGAPEERARDAEGLGSWLRTAEPMIIVLDDLHLSFLRGVDTLYGFQTFSEVVEHAGQKVFWIASFAAQPFAFLRWVTRANLVFRRFINLPAWTEDAIGQLLGKRTMASGWRLSFDDLIVERIPGSGAETQLVSTIRDYNRLIWDMALGSPRSALMYWMHSLIPDGPDSARVRFFTLPETRTLENLSEVERFVLAGIIWHERAQMEEVSQSLRYPPAWCRDAVTRLLEAGIMEKSDGYFRVAPLWWPEVIRYLRRKHLISA